jgi:uncharacterized membrane protein YhaH (DUF805 family)
VTFSESITSASKNLTNFNGRSSRSAFWWWYLLLFVASIVVERILSAILGAMVTDGISIAGLGIWSFLVAIIFQLLIIGVGCRRLHDSGKSGWLQVLLIMPCIGNIILIIMWALPSTPGENTYGPAPTS